MLRAHSFLFYRIFPGMTSAARLCFIDQRVIPTSLKRLLEACGDFWRDLPRITNYPNILTAHWPNRVSISDLSTGQILIGHWIYCSEFSERFYLSELDWPEFTSLFVFELGAFCFYSTAISTKLWVFMRETTAVRSYFRYMIQILSTYVACCHSFSLCHTKVSLNVCNKMYDSFTLG